MAADHIDAPPYEAFGRSLLRNFAALRASVKGNLSSPSLRAELTKLATSSHAMLLEHATPLDLTSAVQGKRYFSFTRDARLSRPINADLYLVKHADLLEQAQVFAAEGIDGIGSWTPADVDKLLYTLAMSFCALIDTIKSGDKKTPGTYFELLCGHLVASRLGINPARSVQVHGTDPPITLPTDFVFDRGPGLPKYHVPVKFSTRERVIQVWAHQRVLDGIFGTGTYRGVLVVMNETKLGQEKLLVEEICLPSQWRVYQGYIAQMTRVYYFDVPNKYAALSMGHPRINVKTFGHFLREADQL